ncbi:MULTISPECIES: PTS sugar transporter subunit IIA [Clostridia]|uniref:PTS sugar transporter subunit IIA n=1 Tax=Clostridia TaxID=186801 RepID=UPI000E5488A1|nr:MULTISPECIES: PTS glucose transporter subunit IIA [Clostridia]RHS80801.1 PTS glucose transporter subunit IIA [Firmicutes bacterium AM43-11BH]RKQ27509.1 PTS glucose transporter subunit IIA [Ruminococcus sp. B05]TAP31653.1 PTS glucose transporter subunit IIA [Mediterraneibacter sp. gm002]
MFFRKKEKKTEIGSPVEGTLMTLNEVNDGVFSTGMMGSGFAVNPSSSFIVAPVDGEVTMVFPTGHALGIKTEFGLEILLHVGIETVNLNGKGFKVNVSKGQKVKCGDLLVEVNLDIIKEEKLDPFVLVIFSNGQDFNLKKIKEESQITSGETIYYVI